MKFVWDTKKAELNKQKHGVDFRTAVLVFSDPGRWEKLDSRHSEDEARWQTVGMGGEKVLFVVFTEREDDAIRIITARKADKDERRRYYRKSYGLHHGS